jgi:hypothetical protein
MASDIRKVGVVGIGLMGSGIAQVAAVKNFDTVVVDVSAEIIAKGMERIRASVRRLVESYQKTSGKSKMSRQKSSSFHPWRNRAIKNSWFPTPRLFPSRAWRARIRPLRSSWACTL